MRKEHGGCQGCPPAAPDDGQPDGPVKLWCVDKVSGKSLRYKVTDQVDTPNAGVPHPSQPNNTGNPEKLRIRTLVKQVMAH